MASERSYRSERRVGHRCMQSVTDASGRTAWFSLDLLSAGPRSTESDSPLRAAGGRTAPTRLAGDSPAAATSRRVRTSGMDADRRGGPLSVAGFGRPRRTRLHRPPVQDEVPAAPALTHSGDPDPRAPASLTGGVGRGHGDNTTAERWRKLSSFRLSDPRRSHGAVPNTRPAPLTRCHHRRVRHDPVPHTRTTVRRSPTIATHGAN